MQIARTAFIALLTLFIFTACTSSSASFYRNAAIVHVAPASPARSASEGSYRIVAGENVVLEKCWQNWQAFPDAFGRHCVLIPLDQSQLGSGAVVIVGPRSNS